MNLQCLLVCVTVLLLPLPSAVHAGDYEFDGTITRAALENYLSRSITMLDLLTGHGNPEDNVRMLKNIGAKFAGRTIYFHSFPLRIVEVPERPQDGVLKMGALDSIYGRSKGGVVPSGWRCEQLPYLVELDNWDVSNRPGQPNLGGCWRWINPGS